MLFPGVALDAECYAIHHGARGSRPPAEECHGVRHQTVFEPETLRHAGESLRHPRGDRGDEPHGQGDLRRRRGVGRGPHWRDAYADHSREPAEPGRAPADMLAPPAHKARHDLTALTA